MARALRKATIVPVLLRAYDRTPPSPAIGRVNDIVTWRCRRLVLYNRHDDDVPTASLRRCGHGRVLADVPCLGGAAPSRACLRHASRRRGWIQHRNAGPGASRGTAGRRRLHPQGWQHRHQNFRQRLGRDRLRLPAPKQGIPVARPAERRSKTRPFPPALKRNGPAAAGARRAFFRTPGSDAGVLTAGFLFGCIAAFCRRSDYGL